jgi:hypothetical protein
MVGLEIQGKGNRMSSPAQNSHQQPLAHDLYSPWSLCFERDGTEDVAVISDADGEELLRSRHFWLPEADDPMPQTLSSMRLVVAAPALLDLANQIVLAKSHDESVPADIYHAAVRILAHVEAKEA